MRIVQERLGLGLKVRNGSSGVQIFQHSMPALSKNKPDCRFRTNNIDKQAQISNRTAWWKGSLKPSKAQKGACKRNNKNSVLSTCQDHYNFHHFKARQLPICICSTPCSFKSTLHWSPTTHKLWDKPSTKAGSLCSGVKLRSKNSKQLP